MYKKHQAGKTTIAAIKLITPVIIVSLDQEVSCTIGMKYIILWNIWPANS